MRSLSDICRPKQWKTISQKVFTETGYPVYGANGKIGFYSEFNHEYETLLITCRGATCGYLNISEPKSYVTGNSMALDNLSPEVDLRFLFYALRHRGFSDVISGSAQPQITREGLEKILIPLPPIPEQRRIVDILSRAEGIVRLRREAQKKAAEIIPALFIDMFGDPATNPKGWPIRKVADFVTRFEGGKNIQSGSKNGSAYRILKVSAVTSGTYRESESKPAPNDYIPSKSHLVREGDMIFSRANTVELVGATAIVESTNGKTLLPDKLWRFIWSGPVEQTYMHALFQSVHVRRELGKLSSGTSASMHNISQGKLFGLKLPVASYSEQHIFAERAAAIYSIQSQQSAATQKAEATFNALLSRAFQGEL
jgi:type I restriction enzyme S subunit